MVICFNNSSRTKEVLTFIMEENKPWYKSQTKIGAVLIAGAAILATVGGYLTGSVDMVSAITALIAEVGAMKLAFGIRDWPVINKKK